MEPKKDVYALILLKKQAKKFMFLKVNFSAGLSLGKNAIPPMYAHPCLQEHLHLMGYRDVSMWKFLVRPQQWWA